MTKPRISLQDLRRRIYAKAKSDTSWRFWGLYVHVCKEETLHEAYRLAKKNHGAPGVDGVSFAAIEAGGVDGFLAQIRDELVSRKYVPMPNRRKEIPKDGGKKVRVLGIPTIRDRVVQGALLLILEPIFEADFQPGSFGYRPGRTAHEAVERVRKAIGQRKTRVIDVDLRAYFDNVKHHILLAKLARRIADRDVLHLVKLILEVTGTKGVPQGGVISPLLSNVYLTQVDLMLEKAKAVTREGPYECVEYARFADDLVILVDGHPRHDRLLGQVNRRLREGWPHSRSRSTKRRAAPVTWRRARALASWGSTSGACAVLGASGTHWPPPSRRSVRNCWGDSARSSPRTGPSPSRTSSRRSTRCYGAGSTTLPMGTRACASLLPAIRKRGNLTSSCPFTGGRGRGVVASRQCRVVLVAAE
jgi:group II intron reverse transcriptase/maturase